MPEKFLPPVGEQVGAISWTRHARDQLARRYGTQLTQHQVDTLIRSPNDGPDEPDPDHWKFLRRLYCLVAGERALATVVLARIGTSDLKVITIMRDPS